MNHYETAIIGGGASGLFAGSILGKKAIILERNNTIGRKLLLTGGGRCNYTHSSTLPELLEHYNASKRFIRPALYSLTPDDIIARFRSLGINPIVEENGKVFPYSGKSHSILDALEKECGTIITNCFIKEIRKENDAFILKSDKETISAKNVIVATGGNSYSQTGSDGYGYTIARKLGHTIINPTPALASLKISPNLAKAEGISLPITIKLDKKEYSGDIVITKNGISGPLAEDISYMLSEERAIRISFTECNIKKLRETNAKSIARNAINLPDRLLTILLGELANKKLTTLTREEENFIQSTLTDFECNAKAIAKSAMSTHGGVSTVEINPKTMESKLVANLYFTGDIIDVDANCGGYSLTWAFASANLAAKAIDKTIY